jgi:hypothetical protein
MGKTVRETHQSLGIGGTLTHPTWNEGIKPPVPKEFQLGMDEEEVGWHIGD